MSKALKILICIFLVAALTAMLAACGVFTGNALKGQNGQGNSVMQAGNSVGQPQNAEDDGLFTVSFETSGGTEILDMRVRELNYEDIPPVYLDDLIFAGWYLDAQCTEEQKAQFPLTLNADVTLYAKWMTNGVKEIRTVQELIDVSRAMAGSYIIVADYLDLKGVNWTPLGMSIVPSADREGKVALENPIVPFTGTFDGNGKTIYNLNLIPIGPEEQYNYLPYGLFSALGQGGIIQNVTLNGMRAHLNGGFSDFYIGGLIGQMRGGLVRNCNVMGTINNPELEYEESLWDYIYDFSSPTSDTFIGGLIGGIMEGDVVNCSAGGVVISESIADGVFVGGLAGFNWNGIIRNCSSNTNVTGHYAGNLVGYNNGYIYDSFATGITSGSMSYPAVSGGLTAYNDLDGIIERCYSTGAVSARTAGGLVGINMFNYSKSAPLNIAGDPILQASGIDSETLTAGRGGIIRNCYSQSNVTANEYGGGLIARIESIMPINGKPDYKAMVTETFYFVSHCFVYGNVSVIAEEISYKNDKGVWIITKGVYHTVFAGGIVGHASEPKMISCLAFGNVTGESKRPVSSGDFIYNTVFADNVIGQCSNILGLNIHDYYIVALRDIYGSVSQRVTRNGTLYNDFNTAEALDYEGARGVNTVTFLTGRQDASFADGLGFNASVWNLNNVRIDQGRRPFLY